MEPEPRDDARAIAELLGVANRLLGQLLARPGVAPPPIYKASDLEEILGMNRRDIKLDVFEVRGQITRLRGKRWGMTPDQLKDYLRRKAVQLGPPVEEQTPPRKGQASPGFAALRKRKMRAPST